MAVLSIWKCQRKLLKPVKKTWWWPLIRGRNRLFYNCFNYLVLCKIRYVYPKQIHVTSEQKDYTLRGHLSSSTQRFSISLKKNPLISTKVFLTWQRRHATTTVSLNRYLFSVTHILVDCYVLFLIMVGFSLLRISSAWLLQLFARPLTNKLNQN